MKTSPNPDPQLLLPELLRNRWIVVPKCCLQWTAFSIMLIGAGIALLMLGIMQGEHDLTFAFPAALGACWIIKNFTNRCDARELDALREYYAGELRGHGRPAHPAD